MGRWRAIGLRRAIGACSTKGSRPGSRARRARLACVSWLRGRVLLVYAPPMDNIAALYDAPDKPSALTRPLFLALIAAGFPSPADDHLDRDLDLHELLIQHPASTFYVRLAGDSMQGAGLYDGDILVVDRSWSPSTPTS